MLTEPRIDVLTLCSRSTGLTKAEVLSIARNAPKRYKVYEIPKRSGQGTRTICHPSRELKALQYFFLREILNTLPVHRSATAYEEGRSIKQNAEAHRLSRVILKVDFDSFFHSIRVANWEKFATDKFPDWSPEEHAFSQRVLFWGRGTASPECLAIGAPTSPRVSNVIMYELDEVLSAYANDADLVYTRYADDITISSREYLDMNATLALIRQSIASTKYTRVTLNERKTRLVSKARMRRVTGIIITSDNRISLGRDRKRLISAMLHRASKSLLNEAETLKLRGLLSFANDAEPEYVNTLIRKYGGELVASVTRLRSTEGR